MESEWGLSGREDHGGPRRKGFWKEEEIGGLGSPSLQGGGWRQTQHLRWARHIYTGPLSLSQNSWELGLLAPFYR